MRIAVLGLHFVIGLCCAVVASAQTKGSIAGVLHASNGLPVAGALMTATGPNQASFSTTTDSAGRYRIENISPGSYVLTAGPASHPTFYPGTTKSNDARTLNVSDGTQVVGIDFTMLTSPGVTVKGRVDQPASNASLSPVVLLSRNAPGLIPTAAPVQMQSAIQADGTFEFTDVLPGTYSVRVLSRGRILVGGTILNSLVVEGSDIPDVNLTLPAFSEVHGYILVDGEPTLPADLARLQVVAKEGSANHYSRLGVPIALLLQEANYSISVPDVPMNYTVESILYGNTNVLNAPLVVKGTMSSDLVVRIASFPPKSNTGVRVRGKVTNLPPVSYMQNPRVLLTRDVRVGGGAAEAAVQSDGSFEFASVPAGAYAVSTKGLAASFVSTLNVANSDIQDMTIALDGIANPFPENPAASIAPNFDRSSVITLRGVITQEFTQIRPPAPTMYLRIEVQDATTGTLKNWAIATSQAGARSPADIPDASRLKAGTRVTITVNPSRDGDNRGWLVKIPGANTTVGINVE